MNSPESRCSARGARLRRCPKIRVRKSWQETGLFPNRTAPKCCDAGGNDHRRRFAVQLCVLRQYGRFLEDYAQVPVKILNHLGRQLQLPPALSLASPDRPATESAQQQRIRSYLGYQPFDEETRSRLEDHLRMQAAQGVLPSQLLQRAEDFLHFWKIILPAPSTLGRLTAAVGATGRQEMLDRIAARLSEPIGEAMDKLLTVEEGAGRSPLFDFKEYPPEATPATILSYLDRCFLLESIGVSQIDLTGFTGRSTSRRCGRQWKPAASLSAWKKEVIRMSCDRDTITWGATCPRF